MVGTKRTFLALLKESLGARVDQSATSFTDMMAEDFIMEFPYARPGMKARIEGRAAVIAYLSTVSEAIEVDSIRNEVVHDTSDPEVVIVEFEAHGRAVRIDEPYVQRYISVIRARGGRLVHFKDYWDPLQGLKARLGSAAVEQFILGSPPQQGGNA